MILTGIRYVDADGAIEWLKAVLGFEAKAVYRDADGVVAHAELTLGTGLVMIGTVGQNAETSGWFVEPRKVGGVTASLYVVVAECAPVYARAQAAGAEIVLALETKEYGGAGFTVRDPEGHVWSVGQYDPAG